MVGEGGLSREIGPQEADTPAGLRLGEMAVFRDDVAVDARRLGVEKRNIGRRAGRGVIPGEDERKHRRRLCPDRGDESRGRHHDQRGGALLR